jgi:hypothetical protein
MHCERGAVRADDRQHVSSGTDQALGGCAELLCSADGLTPDWTRYGPAVYVGGEHERRLLGFRHWWCSSPHMPADLDGPPSIVPWCRLVTSALHRATCVSSSVLRLRSARL